MARLAKTLILVALVATLTGCGREQWLEVRSGRYAQSASGGAGTGALRDLSVDRSTGTVTLTFFDAPARTIRFTPRERDAWPTGCPTNLYEHRMELLELDTDMLRIGDLELQEPILVRNCPQEPERLILQPAGPVSGGGSAACGSCLILFPQ